MICGSVAASAFDIIPIAPSVSLGMTRCQGNAVSCDYLPGEQAWGLRIALMFIAAAV